MRASHRFGWAIALLASAPWPVSVGIARASLAGQDEKPAATGVESPGESIEKIASDYSRQLLELDRKRLDRLTRLAAGQGPAQAADTYQQLFQLAIAGNLFREAEPAALAVIANGGPSTSVVALANLVKIIAECDRGAHDQSLESLRTVIVEKGQAPQVRDASSHLLVTEKIELCDLYFQRLIHADQFDVARKALTLLKEHAEDPEFSSFLTARLARLEMVGKASPPLQGTDIDGKKVSLADSRGDVVLLVFWASWSLPSATEVAVLREVYEKHRGKGFRVVGINVDTLQEGSPKSEIVAPLVRRFLLDRNVPWPNLLNGSGELDYAKAFGVTEIPANVLISRDGTIASIDLVPVNMESSVARLIGR